jgi:hypothetical protein
LLLAKAGASKEAEETVAGAIELGRGFGHFHHTAYNIAATYAALRRPDEAVDRNRRRRWFPLLPIFRTGSQPRHPSRTHPVRRCDVGAARAVEA